MFLKHRGVDGLARIRKIVRFAFECAVLFFGLDCFQFKFGILKLGVDSPIELGVSPVGTNRFDQARWQGVSRFAAHVAIIRLLAQAATRPLGLQLNELIFFFQIFCVLDEKYVTTKWLTSNICFCSFVMAAFLLSTTNLSSFFSSINSNNLDWRSIFSFSTIALVSINYIKTFSQLKVGLVKIYNVIKFKLLLEWNNVI